MRINFDFTDLQAFLAVMDTGSFHLAAARLNLSQPSVTRRIRKLEQDLGLSLFERTTRAVRPTLAAKRLRVSAEALLDTAEETTRALRDESRAFAYQRARLVTVAAIPTALRNVLIPAMHLLRRDHPDLRLRIMDMSANAVAEAVTSGAADLGLCSAPLHDPATRFDRLFEDPLVLAMPKGHRLAERDRVTWHELDTDPLILPARGTGNRLLIDDALARVPDRARWSFEVERTSTALALVENGIGVAPVPRMGLETGQARIQWRRFEAPEILRPVGILTRTTLRLSESVQALRDALATAGTAFSRAQATAKTQPR